jgi:hypothetical protein
LAARSVTSRGRDRTIRATAGGFDRCYSRLRNSAAETGVQRKHERNQCKDPLLHKNQANPLLHCAQHFGPERLAQHDAEQKDIEESARNPLN